MLLDNFYTILSSESSDSTIWTIQIKLNPGHPVYQGHFPEHPVVPGVCLLQLIKECVEDIRQQKLQVTQVSSCKFLSAINPIETPHISVALTFKETEEGTLQLQAEGSVKKEAVKKSTVKESTVEENTVKDECFIKLKLHLPRKHEGTNKYSLLAREVETIRDHRYHPKLQQWKDTGGRHRKCTFLRPRYPCCQRRVYR